MQNVRGVVAEIEASEPLLADLAHRGQLRIVGARYDLDSGAVEWLPAQAAGPAPSERSAVRR